MKYSLLIGVVALATVSCSLPAGEHAGTVAEVQQLVARQPDAKAERSWKYIVLHHSATSSGSVESIDAAHRQRLDSNGQPWRGIGYHFVIGNGDGMADGEVQSTFRWREQCEGAHAGIAQFNQLGIGVCLIGDFEAGPPTEAQLLSLKRLITVLQREYRIDEDRILAHRDFRQTACPGGQFPLARIRGEQGAILQTSGAGE